MKFSWIPRFAAVFFLAAGIPAAQDKPPQDDPPPHPKVWTNEEIARARRPVDLYLDEKQAAEEDRKAAAEKAKKEGEQSCDVPTANKDQKKNDDSRMPTTLEETAERIEAKQYEIEGQEELVKSTEQEYFFAPFEEREERHQRLLRLKSDLASARAELAALEAWREKFSPKKPE